jgi:hypothetical protein
MSSSCIRDGVDDNLALYALLGGVFDRDAAAARLAADFAAARAELAALAATLPREAVLYPIWRGPWMTVRRDTYIAAMLAAAGWDTLPQQASVRYPEFAWDAPWLAGVARVLLPSEPYAFSDRHLAEVRRLAQRPVTPHRRRNGVLVRQPGDRRPALPGRPAPATPESPSSTPALNSRPAARTRSSAPRVPRYASRRPPPQPPA